MLPIEGMLPEGIDMLPIEKPEGIEPEGSAPPLDPMALEGMESWDIPEGIEKPLPAAEDPPVGGRVAAFVVVAVVGPAVVGAFVVVGNQEAGMLIEDGMAKELIGSIPRCSTTPAAFMERPPIMALHRPSPEMKNVTRPDDDEEVGWVKEVILIRPESML